MPPDPIYIQPGSLRHSVSIQVASTTRDAAGQPIATWTQVIATRAAISSTITATYKETFAQNAFSSEATHLVTIRWPGSAITIKPGMKVVFSDNAYLIQAIDNVKRLNRRLNLACIVIDGDSN